MPKRRSHFKKKFLIFISFSGSLFLLSGCWDRWETNDIAIVTATAIDKKEDNQIELSLQIFIPRAFGMSSSPGGASGGGTGGELTFVISQKGVNMADAISKLQAELPRKIFWGQCKVFIFGEKIAKEGIQEHLDFLLRHPQPRERAYMFVSKGKAKHILELQSKLERSSAEAMRELVDLEIGLKVTLKDLNEMLTSEAQAAALPYLKTMTEKGKKKSFQFPKIFGSAVIKKDQMIGYISQRETRGILWLRDEIKGYTVTFEPEGKKGNVSLNPVTAKVDLIPQINGENWSMIVKIQTEGTVIQNNSSLDISKLSNLKVVEKAYQDGIRKRVEFVLVKVQNELRTDIVGFAKEFHRKYPKQWRKVENRWDEVFPEIKIKYDIKAHIRKEGYINKPMKLRIEEEKE
ncbi:Ger(x)C family spore germination protein [Cytobacillus dafuensis]|uniref:Ger(X)C family spore germination protein n=1 Tax=Cytobacillus dafuensis TaxID=1742359 RepID=A0A5B8Z372_CYTDA|nr:Ger(x)C family spore germination protein [Cytobacillus dafuensis]QED47287.1 Ger(x)C family spore germination protein [Cytobacillus dafuensis]